MPKIFVIGLDGATFDLIRPWVAQGRLPTFKKLMENGSWSELRSTVPPVTASAWSSFMTGKNPGAHGLFDFMQRKRDSYDLAPVSVLDRDGKPVWDLIGESGKPVIVMNVPVTWPPQPVNGKLVTGMLTPRNAENYTYPRELADELREHIGDYIVYSDEVYSKGRGEVFLNALRHSAEQRTRAAEYLLQKYPWDYFMLVFPETDTVSHGLWAASDPTHHQHDATEANAYGGSIQGSTLGDGILSIYQFLDARIARLTEKLDPDTTVILMSDHGHGPLRNFLYVNNYLAKLGYLKFKNDPITLLKRAAFALGITPRSVYQFLLVIGLGKLRRTLDKRRGGRGLLKRFFLSLNDVDWSRTRAYSIGYIGEVHLNLRGREPQGIVERGEEYAKLREKLIAALCELKLKNGDSLVEYIWKKEEIYHGAHLESSPDILFLPRHLETIAFGDFEFGSNRIVEPSYGVSSSHRMNGIFVAAGAGIKRAGEFTNAQLIDLAPTILHLLGLPVPRDMDGKVLTDAIADSRPIEYGGTAAGHPGSTEGYSDEEEAQVIERLKDLGYIS